MPAATMNAPSRTGQRLRLGLAAATMLFAGSALGDTPLHEAAQSGNAAKCEQLIKAGADVNAMDPDYGLTPLHWASQSANWALQSAKADIVRALLVGGADKDAKNNNGQTPLDLARLAVLEMLPQRKFPIWLAR